MWWDSLGRPRQIWTCIKVIWVNQKMSSGVIRLGHFVFVFSWQAILKTKGESEKSKKKSSLLVKEQKTNAYLEDPGMIRLQFSMVPGCHPIGYLPGGSFSHPCRADAADIVPTSWGCWEINNGQLEIPQTKRSFRSLGISSVTKWWIFRPAWSAARLWCAKVPCRICDLRRLHQ